MRNAPIVAEIRSIRNELAARCDYDVETIFRRTQERQVRSGLTYVRYPARRATQRKDTRAPRADRQKW